MVGDEARARQLLLEMQERLARDPYEALGVFPSSPATDVRNAFLGLTKTYHPARFARMAADVQKLANEVFLGLRGAHDQLSRPSASPNAPGRRSAPVMPTSRPSTPPVNAVAGRPTTGSHAAQPPPSGARPTGAQPAMPRTTGSQSMPPQTATPQSTRSTGSQAPPPRSSGSHAGIVLPQTGPSQPPAAPTQPASRPQTAPLGSGARPAPGARFVAPESAPTRPFGSQTGQQPPIARPARVSASMPAVSRTSTSPLSSQTRTPAPGPTATPTSSPRVTPAAGVPVPGAARTPTQDRELAPILELMTHGHFAAARVALETMAARSPDVARYRALIAYSRGREAQLAQRINEARVDLMEALQIDPDLDLAKSALSELFTRRK